MNRDYVTGNELNFERWMIPSEGFEMLQHVRGKPKRERINPNRKRIGKGGLEKPGGRIATMQALRYHFGKSCSEIAALMDIRTNNAVKIVSSLTIGGKPEDGLDWWRRKYKQEAIDAAGLLLNAHQDTASEVL